MSVEITPIEIAGLFWRHKTKFAACVLGTLCASAAITALMSPRYRSEALLFVRLGRENVSLDATASMGAGAIVAIPQGREDEINSVVELLQSRALCEMLVDAFGPETLLHGSTPRDDASHQAAIGPAERSSLHIPETLAQWWQRIYPSVEASPRELAIERVQQRLSVHAPKRSTVINVTYDGPSAAIAQQVVSKLVELYMEEHVRLNRTPGTHDFFVEQTTAVRERLNESETALRDLKNATGMASVKDQRLILVQRIGRLGDELLTAQAELSACEAELKSLDAKLKQLPETRITQRTSGLPNQAADGMRQQLYALQLKEQELLTTFQPEARQVQEIRRQIAEARGILAKEEYDRTQSTNGADPTYAQLHLALHTRQTQADSLRSKIEAVDVQVNAAKRALNDLNDNELRLAQLEREVELAEVNYRKYSDNLEQARIDQALRFERISNIGIAQAASYNPRRVRPNGPVNLAVGLLAGLIMGCATVFACEYVRAVQTAHARPANAPSVQLPLREVETAGAGSHSPAGRTLRDLATR